MNKPTYDELIAALSESDHSNLRIKYGKVKAERDALAGQVEQLLSYLQDAHLSLGFLSTHLRGRMAEQALLEMAKEADEWKEFCQAIRQHAKPAGTWLKDSNTHCNAKAGE